MTRKTITGSAVLSIGGLFIGALAGCVERADRCAGTSCPEDRVCIVLASGPRCACADPAVEIDGECVDEGGEGEGEGEDD